MKIEIQHAQTYDKYEKVFKKDVFYIMNILLASKSIYQEHA